MNIEVSCADESDKQLIAQLLELNAHEFSRFDGRDLGDDGKFGYPYIDLYWVPEENRHPFVIRVDGRIAGCVLVRCGAPHQIAELFVVNKFRRHGVGKQAVNHVFHLFQGDWEIEQWVDNVDARAFWSEVLAGRDVTRVTEHDRVMWRFVTP